MTEDANQPSNSPAILVAEDNKHNQLVLCIALNKLGYNNVHIAVNGSEAVEKVKHHDYKLIIMDCQLPVLDGFEATTLIRKYEQNNNKTRVPIIALTADIVESNRNKCLHYDMDEYLIKPLNILKLRGMLTALIKN